ncbi:MAG: hypothetical protein BRC29_04260 [Nanohaloarchaea archaeon SW_7_43_1]|nr:MAG: hypothetical protein BRC29_04260 [Nanohaloarchaea archaeon SW_7_43_1]
MVDTNVLIHGRGEVSDEILIVPGVPEEVESDGAANVLRNLDYEVQEPDGSVLEDVWKKSNEINSPTSEVDEKLLALALECTVPLLTDDKALQNLALHMEVDIRGFLDDPVEEKFSWQKRCNNCGSQVPSSPCPRCGSHQVSQKQVHCS